VSSRGATVARGGEAIAAIAVMAACLAGALIMRRGCGARAEVGTCGRILDKYVEARVRQLDAKPSASTIAASRAESEREAIRSKGLRRCDDTLRAEAAKCALEAGDADAIERCLQ
jgi:hypothetical protein